MIIKQLTKLIQKLDNPKSITNSLITKLQKREIKHSPHGNDRKLVRDKKYNKLGDFLVESINNRVAASAHHLSRLVTIKN